MPVAGSSSSPPRCGARPTTQSGSLLGQYGDPPIAGRIGGAPCIFRNTVVPHPRCIESLHFLPGTMSTELNIDRI
eukprot:3933106-Pyramimonas_sp.AAC.1